jgi:hypothetical protein
LDYSTRELFLLGSGFLSRSFFGSRFFGYGLLGSSSFLGWSGFFDSFARFDAGGFGALGGLLLEASGFVLVDDAFFGGFVDGALGAAVCFAAGALTEELESALECALGFTIADRGFVGCADPLLGGFDDGHGISFFSVTLLIRQKLTIQRGYFFVKAQERTTAPTGIETLVSTSVL